MQGRYRFKIISLICCLFLLLGMSSSMQKILYTVQFKDNCKTPVKNFLVKYDGEKLGYLKPHNIGHLGGDIMTMPMTIPKIATVTWEEENGVKHEYDVPLRALITTKDTVGSKFKIIYGVCDSDLTVVFAKKTGQFEYSKKEIWLSKKES